MVYKRILWQQQKKYTVILDDDSTAKTMPMWMNGIGYVYMSTGKTKMPLGRFLLEIHDKFEEADHVDKDKMNNKMNNLRVVTRRQNAWNRSKFKNNTTGMIGVHISKGRYRVRACNADGTRVSLGCH